MNVLLLNAHGSGGSQWPHYGLVLLATRLRDAGHAAQVVDYNYTPTAPAVEHFVRVYRSDIIGVSLYTISMRESRALIRQIREMTTTPIILGGPHATLYGQELAAENLGDWLFCGECERALVDHLAGVKRESRTVVVKDQPPDASEIPAADFSLAWDGYRNMSYRPIQLSRGCPFGCSFCSVHLIASRQVRYRDIDACLDEIENDVKRNPQLSFVRITDDCPTADLARFKEFLRRYISRKISRPLHIDNLRADRIDDELLGLLKMIGIDFLNLGVESGNPDVFQKIYKGETLQEIEEAADLIKQHGIRLYLCFVLGLPHATAESDMDSIQLARRLKPAWIFWNVYQPSKRTEARRWFEKHGRIYSEECKTSLPALDLTPAEPPCDTPDYSAWQRQRMQVAALLMTGCYALVPWWFRRMARTISHYRLWTAFWLGLPYALRVNYAMLCHRIGRQIRSGHIGVGMVRL